MAAVSSGNMDTTRIEMIISSTTERFPKNAAPQQVLFTLRAVANLSSVLPRGLNFVGFANNKPLLVVNHALNEDGVINYVLGYIHAPIVVEDGDVTNLLPKEALEFIQEARKRNLLARMPSSDGNEIDVMEEVSDE